jgi:hypothetical protein
MAPGENAQPVAATAFRTADKAARIGVACKAGELSGGLERFEIARRGRHLQFQSRRPCTGQHLPRVPELERSLRRRPELKLRLQRNGSLESHTDSLSGVQHDQAGRVTPVGAARRTAESLLDHEAGHRVLLIYAVR